MNKWLGCFGVGLCFSVIMYFVVMNQEDTSQGSFILFVVGVVFTLVSMVMVNVYNAKEKGMSAGEYLEDRFANAIPETKELFGVGGNDTSGVTVKCPYCQSVNTRRISTISKMARVSLFGKYAMRKVLSQWHCNNCGSDF